MNAFDYDVLVIGSGFGGSVAALRLTGKGYWVGVLEAGRRFDDPADPVPGQRHGSLPKTSWRISRYMWAPQFGLTGIQRIHVLRGEKGSRLVVLGGAGVGGGSLVYANTLYRPCRDGAARASPRLAAAARPGPAGPEPWPCQRD